MLPTLNEYKKGVTNWDHRYRDIPIRLTHHSAYGDTPHGIWNYYLFLKEPMFAYPDVFKLFSLGKYGNIPDLKFHGGVSFIEKSTFLYRPTMTICCLVKIGCDYNHLSDENLQELYTYSSVLQDAKDSVDFLYSNYKLNTVCCYSGIMAPRSEFIETSTGTFIHKTAKKQFDTVDPANDF